MNGPWVGPRVYVVCIIALIGLTDAQKHKASTGSTKCCNTKLMDSAGYVMIEGYKPLEQMIVKGVMSTLCLDSLDPFQLSVWRRTSGTGQNATYALHWNYTIKPLASWNREFTTLWQTALGENEQFVIGPDNYFGIWAKESVRIPVPFDFDSQNDAFSFYLSSQRYTDESQITEETSLTHAGYIKWPRSFLGWLSFCSKADCSDQTGKSSSIGPVGPPGLPGAPGPVGPPGANTIIGGGNDVVSGEILCAVPEVETQVINAQIHIQTLSNQIEQMQQALNAIYNSNSVTGLCPTGMVPGTYGVGSCYSIQLTMAPMGVAEMACRQIFQGHLISIESPLEEQFIRNEILLLSANRTVSAKNAVQQYWTAAMFNKGQRMWIWYNEARFSEPVLQYTNWKERFAPTPLEEDEDVCSTLNVNSLTSESNWDSINCHKYRPFICEVAKKCL